uniref:C-C motif chemokine 20-like n=1 Tax=Haplochromis burtoni TaxID=8153 RepID=A0A3Q2WTG9_HAPBU
MTVKILSITLLLLSVCFLTFYLSDTRVRGPGSNRPCCVGVDKDNRTAEVVGETYREQAARGHCVKAIIFNTKKGPLCADPKAQWVKDLTAKMRKV